MTYVNDTDFPSNWIKDLYVIPFLAWKDDFPFFSLIFGAQVFGLVFCVSPLFESDLTTFLGTERRHSLGGILKVGLLVDKF